MKFIYSIAATIFFATLLTVPTFAQTGATTLSGAKVAVINSAVFADEKTGITRFVQALKNLQTQFQPRETELQGLTERYNTLVKDIDNLAKSKAPVAPETINQKREQAENLQKEINRKTEDGREAYNKGLNSALGPISADIGRAIQDYAKQKGYSVILDISKDQNGFIVWADMQTADVTADFVKFYNARPAGTATSGASKPTTAAAKP